MKEINEIQMQEKKLDKICNLLLEIKCIIRISALASDSCIIDDSLQMQDHIEYYFVLKRLIDIVEQVENLLQ